MQSNILTAVFMPIAIGIIMLGLGLHLTLDDFKRIFLMPKAVMVGLGCQLLVLPLCCLGIAHAFGLEPELAVGLMLLSAAPGGPSANLYSHLANGDVALNITLTAVNSVLAILTLPLIVNLSLYHFMGADTNMGLQFDKVVQVFAVVLIPVSIGMYIHNRAPEFSTRMEKPVKIFSALLLLIIIIAAVLKEWDNIGHFARVAGGAALTFNLVSMGLGYGLPLLVKLSKKQAIAIGMEVGIHNGSLAIAIATHPMLLNNTVMSIPPAVYSIFMFFTAAAFGWLVNRGRSGDVEGNPASVHTSS